MHEGTRCALLKIETEKLVNTLMKELVQKLSTSAVTGKVHNTCTI